jgi:hypothetical protein
MPNEFSFGNTTTGMYSSPRDGVKLLAETRAASLTEEVFGGSYSQLAFLTGEEFAIQMKLRIRAKILRRKG